MVRNSSSLITLFALASELSEQEKEHVAFALIDEGTRSEYGLKMLDAYLNGKSIKRVYLDAIGNTGRLQCFSRDEISISADMEWHEKRKAMDPYGDILLTRGEFQNSAVILRDDKNDQAIEHIMSTADALHELIRQCFDV